MKRTIRDLSIRDKRLLVRVDFNVPLGDDGSITNDRRIRAGLPNIRYALEEGASLVLMTHLGRPNGTPQPRLMLDRVAARFRELLDGPAVFKCDQVVGSEAMGMAEQLTSGQILLLENLRFDAREKEGDEEFARMLAAMGEFYVNDAFATCHRRHASVHTVPLQFEAGKRVIGLLVEKECAALSEVLEDPAEPLVVVMGGAKVSDKLDVLVSLADRADRILVGGAMAYSFLKAQGRKVGDSKVQDDQIKELENLPAAITDKLMLPQDHVIAHKPKGSAERKTVEGDIPDDWLGMDLGPRSIELFSTEIRKAKTVIWNGPMGVFEEAPFRDGTQAIAQAIAQVEADTIVGGGETIEALEQFGLVDQITHLSTGGGAFLEFLANGSLPALEVIEDKEAIATPSTSTRRSP